MQSGATAALCFESARLLGLLQGYWAGMTAIVVLHKLYSSGPRSCSRDGWRAALYQEQRALHSAASTFEK